jgi:hypothetical protein
MVWHNMKYLKIHTLEKGWHDRDEIMPHAVFQILVFVEQEKPVTLPTGDGLSA